MSNTPHFSITDMLDNAIYTHLREGPTRKWFPLRPSAAGYCARKLAYNLAEYHDMATYQKEYNEPNQHRLLALGSSVEYSALRNFDLVKDIEIRYKQQAVTLFQLEPVGDEKAPLIEGSVDAVFFIDEHKIVLDVKSKKDGFSAAFKTRWDEDNAKYNKHPLLTKISENEWYIDDLEAFINESGDDFFNNNLYQINSYCFSEFFMERGVKFGAVYQYCKNDSRHRVIQFKPSKEVFLRVYEKFQRVYTNTLTKGPESVEKDYNLGSMVCAFCEYKKECWGQDALKAWFKTFPKKEWPFEMDEKFDLTKSILHYLDEQKYVDTDLEKLYQEILTDLVKRNITKFRLPDGRIFEVKYLKSPREHFELRASKL